MRGGESHSYEIELKAGKYLHLVVDQRGVDVVLTLFAPDGKPLLEVDSPNDAQGPEPLTFIAKASGKYRLQVHTLEKEAPAGHYQLRLLELRTANDNDRALFEATNLIKEAQQVSDAGRMDQAIGLAERALAIREKILKSNHPEVAQSLQLLAGFYYAKRDFAKTESLYLRALAVEEKALGTDHPDVASALDHLAGFYHKRGEYAKAEPFYLRSLAIDEKVFGLNHPEVVQTLDHLAAFYETRGNIARAIALRTRAGEASERSLAASATEDAGQSEAQSPILLGEFYSIG
jgi:tetratricopeptide (TPR) repeat protein